MLLNFAKVNPNGNITLLVLDPVPRARQAAIAEELMRDSGVQAEQVGFLEKATLPGAQARLQMMGGEFCGNATMALSAYLAWKEGAVCGEERSYTLEVSGAKTALECPVRVVGEGAFEGEVPMPLPEEIMEAELFPGCTVPVVRFPGIVHALLPENIMEDMQAQSLIAKSCARFQTDAMGFVFVNADFSRIRPLVYVQNTHSAVWENGCGSGTAALGAWHAAVCGGTVKLNVRQPGAGCCIGVNARFVRGKINRMSIRGSVEMVAIGQAWIADESKSVWQEKAFE